MHKISIDVISTITTAFKCDADGIDGWWSEWVIHLNSAPTDISSNDFRLTVKFLTAISAFYLSTTVCPTACTFTGWKRLTIYKSDQNINVQYMQLYGVAVISDSMLVCL